MTRVTQAKLGLALVGVVVFFAGVQTEQDLLRWIGIGFAAVAWLLRFVERGQRRAAADDQASGR
jgi:hypothetical protein